MSIAHKYIKEITPMSEQRAKEIEALSDDDLNFEDIPPLDETFFKTAKRVKKIQKISINITLDPDVAEVFTTSEEVNNALRSLLTAIPK
jgi:hypothetical protein